MSSTSPMKPLNPVRDPITEGLARGWKVTDGRRLQAPLTLEADVVIVGTGAGGATAADLNVEVDAAG